MTLLLLSGLLVAVVGVAVAAFGAARSRGFLMFAACAAVLGVALLIGQMFIGLNFYGEGEDPLWLGAVRWAGALLVICAFVGAFASLINGALAGVIQRRRA